MSKKDYIAIAKVIAASIAPSDDLHVPEREKMQSRKIAHDLATVFSVRSEFDYGRFITACGF